MLFMDSICRNNSHIINLLVCWNKEPKQVEGKRWTLTRRMRVNPDCKMNGSVLTPPHIGSNSPPGSDNCCSWWEIFGGIKKKWKMNLSFLKSTLFTSAVTFHTPKLKILSQYGEGLLMTPHIVCSELTSRLRLSSFIFKLYYLFKRQELWSLLHQEG